MREKSEINDLAAYRLAEETTDGFILVDARGVIVAVNPATEALFGWDRASLLGLSVECLLPERLRGAHVAQREGFQVAPLARPMSAGFSVQARRRDGTEFSAEVSLSPLRTPQGLFTLASVRDVSARKRAEEALRQSEQRFRDLVEQAPDGIIINDAEGRHVTVNTAACRMLGYSREELLEKTVVDILAPEEVPRLRSMLERPTRPAVPVVAEWMLVRKDGTQVSVEINVSALSDGSWQAILRDVSERVQLQREREEAFRLLDAVLEQCPVGISIITPREGEPHIRFNRRGQQIFGFTASPTRSAELLPYVRRPDGADVLKDDALGWRVLRGERVEPVELAVHRADGVRVPVLARAEPIVSPRGEVVGGVIVFEDITWEKDVERLRAEWNAVVAHDLRNPLNNIALHAQLLARGVRGREALTESVEAVQSATARLNRMVLDLLDLSRAEAGRLKVVPSALCLTEATRKAVERASLAAQGRHFELCHDDALTVLADDDRLAQVMDNLLSNAIKYGASECTIRVTVERVGGEASVSVTNEGEPLPREMIHQLFQRFQRGDERRIAGIKGVGLGLYITRELIEAQGGRISAESTPEGRTTFRFTLPLAEAA